MSEQRELVVDIDDQLLKGIYRDFDSNVRASLGAIVEKDSLPKKFRFCRRSRSPERFWDDVNTAGAQLRWSLGTARNVLAMTTAYANTAIGNVTLAQRQAGTATKREIQRIVFSSGLEVYDGNIIANFNRPLIFRIPITNNKGAAQKYSFPTQADAAGSLAGKYQDAYDSAGKVRIWLSNGVAAAPDVPPGGRLLPVTYVNGDSAATIATKMQAAIDPDAALIATKDGTTVYVQQAVAGIRTNPDPGTLTWVTTIVTAGTIGPLTGKTFKAYDDEGDIAIVFLRAGDVMPPEAEDLDRQITVIVTDNDTAATVAAAATAVIDADAKLAAITVAGTNTVEVTDSVGGERTEPVDINSGLDIQVKQHGKSFSHNFLYDSNPDEIASGFDGYWEVKRTDSGNIDFRAAAVGPQPLMTIDVGDLSFPNVVEINWDIATPEMSTYMNAYLAANPAAQWATLVYELKAMFPGQGWNTIIRMQVAVYFTIFNGGITGSIPTVPLVGTNFRITAAPTLQIKDAASGLFHVINIVDVGGTKTLDVDQVGLA